MNQNEFESSFTGLLPLVDTNSPKPTMFRKLPEDCQNLPAYKNWVIERKVSTVKNQGNCRSSYLLQAVAAIESAVAIEHGVNITELSTQRALECVRNMTGTVTGCTGGR